MSEASEQQASNGARGYSWPPFEPGHTLSVRSGAYSERAIEAKADQVRSALFEVCAWLDPELDVIAVARFCRVEARALMLDAYVWELVDKGGPGAVPERTLTNVTQMDKLAAHLGNELGLDPLGRARLKQIAASTQGALANLDLGGLMKKGGKIRRKKEPS